MEKLVVIKTVEQLNQLKEYLAQQDFIAFDSETTGLDPESQIIGFSFCADLELAYYVVTSYWDVAEQKLIDLPTKAHAADILSVLLGKHLIAHNGLFDCNMVKNNYGVDLLPYLHTDTLILGHILDENRHNGLKELATSIFGEDSRTEQNEMKQSVTANGGLLTKDCYELYKGDADLIAHYGAKDAILTLKLFYEFVPKLMDMRLDDFFYKDECMRLLTGPTNDLNTTGLKVDPEKLKNLKGTLEAECAEAKAFINSEVAPFVKDKYPGTNKRNGFNIGSSKQLAWLLFFRLENEFALLTPEGKELCKALGLKLPYAPKDKHAFIRTVQDSFGSTWSDSRFDKRTKKLKKAKQVREPWNYLACGKDTLKKFATKYKWVDRYLQYAKNLKILNTYVEGIGARMKYGVIRPSYKQHGTTSGRYSCTNPNFQNLPRDDKRVKACIVSRPGKVFVGADYSQLEPRVFASFSKDERLLECFRSGMDFYSVIGMEIFHKTDCTPYKDTGPDAFGIKYKKLRDAAKETALSVTYGTTAPKLSPRLNIPMQEAQEIIDNYLETFPSVHQLMLKSHEQARTKGVVYNLFGRPRRIPKALQINKICGKDATHGELPYEFRNLLNLAVNHRIQSTGASIMNRAAIAFFDRCRLLGWSDVKIVMQVHDELVVEGPEELAEQIVIELKHAMEHTVELPGVQLIAEPKISYNLADLK